MRPVLTEVQRRFLNGWQGGFPLAERPFAEVAERIGCTELGLLGAVGDLLESGLLSRFGPLYDASALGGAQTLAALEAPEAEFERIAGQVNAFPEVAHNYRRGHRLNLWFVVAAPDRGRVEQTLGEIEAVTGCRVLALPKLREFRLGLWLVVDDHGRCDVRPLPCAPGRGGVDLDVADRRLLTATQAGLPLDPHPYATVGCGLGMAEAEVRGRLRRLLAGGAVRRIGAVPNHYRLGLRANAMTVWDVPDPAVAEAGTCLAALPFVTHAYERPRHPPIWPYNLFAMVHGPDRETVDRRIRRLEGKLAGLAGGHATLYSRALLKKTGLRLVA